MRNLKAYIYSIIGIFLLIGISNASSIAEEIVSKNYSARKVEYLIRNKKEN